MARANKLLTVFSLSVKAGGGIHTANELAFMLGEDYTPAFTKFLSTCVKKGILRRVSNGIFESTLTPSEPTTADRKSTRLNSSHVRISYAVFCLKKKKKKITEKSQQKTKNKIKKLKHMYTI